jgi:hypothetical protein
MDRVVMKFMLPKVKAPGPTRNWPEPLGLKARSGIYAIVAIRFRGADMRRPDGFDDWLDPTAGADTPPPP